LIPVVIGAAVLKAVVDSAVANEDVVPNGTAIDVDKLAALVDAIVVDINPCVVGAGVEVGKAVACVVENAPVVVVEQCWLPSAEKLLVPHASHDCEPLVAENFPATQLEHSAAPDADEYLPAPHMRQRVAPVAG
jgi:hypothetical protein